MTTRSVVLALAVLAAACAGSDFSSDPIDAGLDSLAPDGGGGTGAVAGAGGSAGSADSGGGTGGGSAGGGGIDAALDGELDAFDDGAEDAQIEAGELEGGDACVLVAYYFDGDGDGFGSTTTISACEKPDGAWVTVGGDCDDGYASVNPAQTSYFAVGYAKTGSSEISFDYDCSGVEKEAGASPKAACQVQGLGCVGGGYLVATPFRSGPGVNPYCGSEQRVNCNYTNFKCPESAPYAAPTIACR